MSLELSSFAFALLLIPLGHIIFGAGVRRANPLTKFILIMLGAFYTPFIRIGWQALLDPRLYRHPLLKWMPVLFGWVVTKANYGGEVYSLQELEYLFQKVYMRHRELHVTLSPCVCRHTTGYYEEGKPALSCIHLQFMADAFVRALPEDARFIPPEMALELLRKWDKDGHCHLLYGFCPQQDSYNWSKQIALCACGPHCLVVHSHNKLRDTAFEPLKKSPFVAVVDSDRCLGKEKCGQCDLCSFFAISFPEGKAEIDGEKCMGCAVCANHCSRKAIKMEEQAGETRNRFINPGFTDHEIKPLWGWRRFMSNKTAGLILMLGAVAVMALGVFFILLAPALGISLGADPYVVGYWAMGIVVVLMMTVVLMMLAWMGYSTYITPPAQVSAEELAQLEQMETEIRQAMEETKGEK